MNENVVTPTGKIRLFTETQYIEQQIQHRLSDFEGDTIIIIPEWVIQAIQSGRIK